jgi:two-component system response regulator FixJ
VAQQVDVVDDDREMRDSMRALLAAAGYATRSYASAISFLDDIDITTACVIADVRMPKMGGLELQTELANRSVHLPMIIMTGFGNVPLAVRSLQAGAIDFIEKPFTHEAILFCVRRAIQIGASASLGLEAREARELVACLTARERDVLHLLVDGSSNKVAAYELGISPRTIENHRASIMDKMNARNLSDVVRVALAAR